VGSGGAQFDVLTPTTVTGAQAFSITNADGSTSTVNVTLGAAGTYKTVQDVADALNSSGSFNGSLNARVNDSNQLVVSSLTGASVVGGGTAGTDATSGTGFSASTQIAAGSLDFSSATGAAAAITLIDTQITSISGARADLGAIQNRFESTINSLNVSAENLSAAESRIRDTDMASEMVKFTAKNILSQAGTAMLAQANQANQGVLQLLR
jgi:flagellin